MIPIRNVYYMLAYAWNHLQESRTIDLSGIDAETPEDLLAIVLARGTLRLLKRGVDRDYLNREQALRSVRGKIHVSATVTRALRTRGEVACRFDELSEDVLANRIIAATLRALLRVDSMSSCVRREVELVSGRFPRLSPLRITATDFTGVVIHRNNRVYRFLLDVCRLIHDNLISDQSATGALRFRDFRDDEATMHKLFEDFVRNFFKIEQTEFKVHSPRIPWDVTDSDEHSSLYLPAMWTDVVLEGPEAVKVIDTKYYSNPLSNRYESQKVHSGNLYQIYSYVMNCLRSRLFERRHVEGVLLYASIGRPFVVRYSISDVPFMACSIDLAAPWQEISQSLLRIGLSRGSNRESRPEQVHA